MKKIKNSRKEHIFIADAPFDAIPAPEVLTALSESSTFSIRMMFKDV